MNEGLVLYVPGAVIAAALIVKAPTLRRGWEQPLMRAVCTLLVGGSLAVFLSAPPTIVAVNRLTGVVNFSAPLVYSLLTAFSGACVVVILHWSGTPAALVRRATRLTVAAYGTVVVAIVTLFALGEAPVERVRDMDTYYAHTPFLREMIICYLAAHTVGSTALTVLCRKWLRRLSPSMLPLRPLRTGLALLMLGGAFDLAFLAAKWTAMVARWSGRDLDHLSTTVAPPLGAAAALLVGAGFLVPLVGGSAPWKDYCRYRRLRPLWAALRGFSPGGLRPVPLTWWSPVGIRLVHRESVIDDGILALGCWFDPAVREEAYGAARAQGRSEEEAALVSDAAMLAAACRHRAEADRAEADRADADLAGAGQGAGREAAPAAGAHPDFPGPPYRLDSRPLTELAHAFHTSPIVARARDRATRS
ncbi:MAB_1171c family putative transporter [Streptomyces sp. NPDC002812]|uniref:MAB_1171c family putative transporter n=1 Tax=Streptomyces sp. NPDC002812 TaxID=3154434 RepID=UPI00332F6C83